MQEHRDTNKKMPIRIPVKRNSDVDSLYYQDMSYSNFYPNIGYESIDELNKILKKENLVEAYNAYVDKDIEKILSSEYKDDLAYVKLYVDALGVDGAKKIFYIYGYKDFKTDEEAKMYFKAKIQLYNYILNKYIDMLKYNYTVLKLSINKSNDMIKHLKGGQNVKEIINNIYELLTSSDEIINTYKRDWGYDFTQYGGGKIFFDRNDRGMENINLKKMFALSFNWDVVVVAHGGTRVSNPSMSLIEASILDKYNSIILKKYHGASDKVILYELEQILTPDELDYYKNKITDIKKANAKYIQMYTDRVPFLIIKKLFNRIKYYWGISPLHTPYGVFTSIDDICFACIENGDKRIKILSCNPSAFKISDDFSKYGDDVIIEYEQRSILIESFLYLDFKKIKESISMFIKKTKDDFSRFFKSISSKTSALFKKEDKIFSTDKYISIGDDGKAIMTSINSVNAHDVESKFNEMNLSILKAYNKEMK